MFVAQVNKNVPRTFGDAMVHQSHLDVIVDGDMPLWETKKTTASDIENKIGELIASNLVAEGATLQMGELFDNDMQIRQGTKEVLV